MLADSDAGQNAFGFASLTINCVGGPASVTSVLDQGWSNGLSF